MKRMKLFAASVGILLVAVTAGAQSETNRLTVPFSDPLRPGMVKVSLFNGGITIRATTGRDVIVMSRDKDGIANGREQPSGKGTGLRRLNQPRGVSVTEENNVMTVSSGKLNGGGDIEIQVPARTNLKLSTTNGDEIVVEHIDGDIEVTALNASVTLTDVAGAAVVHATNGDVKVLLRQVTADKPMAFTSFNGDVDVTLPTGVKANLKMTADRGEVLTDFDVQIQARPATTPTAIDKAVPPIMQRKATNAGRRFELDSSIYGSVNGGGPEFELRTFNGDIYLRKGK